MWFMQTLQLFVLKNTYDVGCSTVNPWPWPPPPPADFSFDVFSCSGIDIIGSFDWNVINTSSLLLQKNASIIYQSLFSIPLNYLVRYNITIRGIFPRNVLKPCEHTQLINCVIIKTNLRFLSQQHVHGHLLFKGKFIH